ncbi:MAG: type II toxin-antitoxin system RelE/ParE family toxin [Nevskiaceae bacterium]|nr:MAG: type II toxin-antitoxin system RelE/ParE family toxin [Nevskiaceae bacterium]TBR73537.1 MAG: type II toxin-antitoxin system RelE/ParE family toxin [Nevskiaceae bacterium]
MKARPVVPRALAVQDVEEAVSYYLSAGTKQAAPGFIDALERAYTHIGRNPAAGSPRYAHELDLPGLRSWPLKRHPHIVFYIEHPDWIDVWRVLHGMRNIPAWLHDSSEDAYRARHLPRCDRTGLTEPGRVTASRRNGQTTQSASDKPGTRSNSRTLWLTSVTPR